MATRTRIMRKRFSPRALAAKLLPLTLGVLASQLYSRKCSDVRVKTARTRDAYPSVACWILRANTPRDLARSDAIRRGWGKTCAHLEFIDRDTPGIRVDWVETYDAVSAKSWRAWTFMYEKYANASFANATRVDFVLKADTDTYVHGAHLLRYLNRFDATLPHYIGRQFVERGVAFVAGATIVLSREALRLVTVASRDGVGACARGKFTATKAEDVALALCLRDVGVYPHNSRDASGAERFMVFSPQRMRAGSEGLPRWYVKRSLNAQQGPGCCSDEAISFHYVSTDELARARLVRARGAWSWTPAVASEPPPP